MVSNTEFEKHSKNIEYTKIMNSVLRKYRNNLDEDERVQVRNIALFEALDTYDPKYKSKFETHLYNKTFYTLFKLFDMENKQTKHLEYYSEVRDNRNTHYFDNFEMVDVLCDLNPKDRELLEYRYIHNMSLVELGQKYNLTKETIRLRIINILEKLDDTRTNCQR